MLLKYPLEKCPHCHCMTYTIPSNEMGLSCGKCGFKKELECLRRLKGGMCAHGRPEGQACPHCLGINRGQ